MMVRIIRFQNHRKSGTSISFWLFLNDIFICTVTEETCFAMIYKRFCNVFNMFLYCLCTTFVLYTQIGVFVKHLKLTILVPCPGVAITFIPA